MQAIHATPNNPEILLLNPPFGPPASPYISIPVLAAYLRSRNISVAAYDLKSEFYVRLLTPQNILNGLKYSQERFLELNNQAKLHFAELFEYWMHTIILAESQIFKRQLEKLILPFADFSDVQNSHALNFFIRAATFQYFPEVIIPDFIFGVGSAYSPNSSADILTASHAENRYTRVFETIIADQIAPRYQPRIVGFSVVFTTQILPAFQCAHILRKYLPDVHITMGGPCISTYFRALQEKRLFTLVDSLVFDEGEIPLERLSQELAKPTPELSAVPGLVYLADQTIRFNPPAPPLDMEQSPPPDYTVFPLDKYLFRDKQLMVPFRLSKGCSWRKCTFCRTDLHICRNYQQPPMEFVYEQLVQVVKHSGLTSFLFSDETANPRVLEYVAKRALSENLKINWIAHTRVSKQLTKERWELYRRAGCMQMTLGIESFSDRILALMQKGISVKLIEAVLTDIDKSLPVTAYMIVGFPSETEEEAVAGYARLRSFISQGFIKGYYYSTLRIYYGSGIWKHPEQYDVSEMIIPEGNDLFPDVIDFRSSGMRPVTAHGLGIKFNQPFDPLSRYMSFQGLQKENKFIAARYDVKQIAELCASKSFTILPFVQWLQNTDAAIYPS
jgi:anaerobic magnesium-protoporphyrin IX monomethyl ester cyclase